MSIYTEFRCPSNFRRMFAKLQGAPLAIVPGNLMEFACQDCAKVYRLTDPTVSRVLHRYDLLGALIESSVEHDRPGGAHPSIR